MTALPILLLLAAPLVQDVETFGAPVLRQVAIDLARHSDLDWRRLDLDVYLRPREADGVLHVLADDVELARLRALGVTWTVVVEDQTAFYQSRLTPGGAAAGSLGAWLSPPFGQGQMGGYYTFAQVASVLDQMTAAYPAITAAKTSIGLSVEGRSLWMVKISDNPGTDENEPEVRFDALHHAREPGSMQATLWMMLFLLEGYGTDPLATWLVDNRELYFLPVVNADGYVHNQQTAPGGGGMWRKNRRNLGGGVFGVDLNRNYPYRWGYDSTGSSGNPASSVYRGPSPASEPETQAMVAFLSARNFATAQSTHTFSDLWLYPYGYDFVLPSNVADYDELSILQTAINGYTVGAAASVLYKANGVTIDYDQAIHGTMSWTPELGGASDGFWPPTSQIIPLSDENLLAFQRTALGAGAFVYVLDSGLADIGDGDGNFEAGETVALAVTVRNSGRAASGAVTATLTTLSPDATIQNGSHSFGAVGSFAQASTGIAPLSLLIHPGTPSATQINYLLTIDYEGYVQTEAGSLTVGELRTFVFDDAEIDLGWTLGLPSDTASTGLWTRANPIGTSSSGVPVNPEDDFSSAGVRCFVTGNGGGSAGNDDVDSGLTTLISPRFDLSGVGPATLSYARWYALLSQIDDTFRIDLSNDDGLSWVPLESVTTNENSWSVQSFQVSDFLPQTARMRLRFIAEDDPNNSLVEGAVDDLRIDVYDDAPRFNVFGSPSIGTQVALNVTGEGGAPFTVFFSTNTGSLTVPGVEGTILLDLATSVTLLSGVLPGSGSSRTISTIPDNPTLVGQTVYLQTLVLGSTIAVTNRAEITIE